MLKFVELNNKQLLESDKARKLLIGDAANWDRAWFGRGFSKPDKIVSVEKNYSLAEFRQPARKMPARLIYIST